jgi:hypothetical protein
MLGRAAHFTKPLVYRCLFFIRIACEKNQAVTHYLHFVCIADASRVVNYYEMLSRALCVSTRGMLHTNGLLCMFSGFSTLWLPNSHIWLIIRESDWRESMIGTQVKDFRRSLIPGQMSDLAGQKHKKESKSIGRKQVIDKCCYF